MDGIFSVLASPLPFIVLISIVITVHELGHYWVGRGFGAAVESFSIGFGRPIVETRDKRGTRWRINWLPLGGFVKFVGEMQAPTDTRETQETIAARAELEPVKLVGKLYTELGPMKRLAVSLGGPLANFIFAIVVFAFLGLAFGVPPSKQISVVVQGALFVEGPASEVARDPRVRQVYLGESEIEHHLDTPSTGQGGAA